MLVCVDDSEYDQLSVDDVALGVLVCVDVSEYDQLCVGVALGVAEAVIVGVVIDVVSSDTPVVALVSP